MHMKPIRASLAPLLFPAHVLSDLASTVSKVRSLMMSDLGVLTKVLTLHRSAAGG